MWYYVATAIIISHIADILSVGEKIYKVCNGVYYVTSCGKQYFFPSKQITNDSIDIEEEWIELKSFKNEECQTE